MCVCVCLSVYLPVVYCCCFATADIHILFLIVVLISNFFLFSFWWSSRMCGVVFKEGLGDKRRRLTEQRRGEI